MTALRRHQPGDRLGDLVIAHRSVGVVALACAFCGSVLRRVGVSHLAVIAHRAANGAKQHRRCSCQRAALVERPERVAPPTGDPVADLIAGRIDRADPETEARALAVIAARKPEARAWFASRNRFGEERRWPRVGAEATEEADPWEDE